MKHPVPDKKPPKPGSTFTDAATIDLKYGLEPVIELGSDLLDPDAQVREASAGVQFRVVECPYCGESFETLVDTSSGSARYVEDCQVCCRPIEFNLDVDHAGVLVAFSTLRSD
jgi:hypothetical protein